MSTHAKILIALVLGVIALLGYAYYQQYVEYLDPCPLCLTQRAFYMLVGIFALVALALPRHGGLGGIAYLLMSVSAVGGIVTAGRQVWLQHLPPEKVPECGPGLQYWIDNMPALETLKLLFKGDGNCAEVDWTFLGFSMAEWSLLMFVLILLVCLWLLLSRQRHARMVTA